MESEPDPSHSLDYWLAKEEECLKGAAIAKANIDRLIEDHRLAMAGQRLDELQHEPLTQEQIDKIMRQG